MPALTKKCSRCGAAFTCGQEQACWCAEMRVDAAVLAGLRRRFPDCLCEACLRAEAAAKPGAAH